MTEVKDSATMRNLWRRILVSLVVTMVAAPTAASAQDDITAAEAEAAEAALAAIGLTFDDVLAEDANSSWDGLGLFSEDSTRLLNAVSEEVAFETYAFGDSKDVPPILEVDGSIATGAGTAAWRLPDDWTPPAEGLGDSMAFAQTPSSQLAPGDDVLLLWLEFDSNYDFSSGLTLNEGFPMTIPGLPVWNSTFAGDTWEGANLIPNAVYDGATLTFDVKGYEPPQSFPLVDLAGFYYRSGNVMSVALSLDALTEFVAAAANSNAATPDQGGTQTLLYTGGAETTTVQIDLGQVLFGVLLNAWLHIATSPFAPGIILLALLPALALGVPDFRIMSPLGLISLYFEILAPTTTSTSTTTTTTTTSTTTTTAAPTTSAPDETEGGANPSGSTSSTVDIWWLMFAVAVVAIVAGALWVWLVGKKKEEKKPNYVGGTRVRTKKKDLHTTPRGSTPPDTRERPPCDWAVVFQGDTQTTYLRKPAPGLKECCTYYIRVRSMSQMHDQNASFRQDIQPERTYIPDIDFKWNGIDYEQNASTRSGPLGRQDWQHGDGNPIDQSALSEGEGFWQQGQGEIPPELVAQIGHHDTTQIRVYLKSGCTGHENTYESRGSGELINLLTSECTNDAPGESCPVELTAQGLHDGSVFGDLRFNFGSWTGSDIDELERYLEQSNERGDDDPFPVPPALPNPGKWDGHTHDTSLQTPTREQTFADGDHSVKTGDNWLTHINTTSWCEAAQQVPEAVYDTTERVSSHVDARFSYKFWIRGTMEKELCEPGPCAGHTELQCHGTPHFEMTLDAGTQEIVVDGKKHAIFRPISADRHNPPALHQWRRWELR